MRPLILMKSSKIIAQINTYKNREFNLRDPLFLSALKIAHIHKVDRDVSTNDFLVPFIKKMVAHELVVGGPYSEMNVDDYLTNRAIQILIKSVGIDLPNIDRYVAENKEHNPDLEYTLLAIDKNLNATTKHLNNSRGWSVYSEIEAYSIFKNSVFENEFNIQLKRISSFDKNIEIGGFSNKFLSALNVDTTDRVYKIAKKMDAANVYAWIAYMIYDNVIDKDEGSSSRLIPLANIAQRHAFLSFVECAKKLDQDSGLVIQSFDYIDSANREELSDNITLERAEKLLFQKSLGHILGPRLIARKLLSKEDCLLIDDALCNFLATKQMIDDVKDWRDDYNSGRKTYFNVSLHLYQKNGLSDVINNEYVLNTHIPKMLAYANDKILESYDLLTKKIKIDKGSDLMQTIFSPLISNISRAKLDINERISFIKNLNQSSRS